MIAPFLYAWAALCLGWILWQNETAHDIPTAFGVLLVSLFWPVAVPLCWFMEQLQKRRQRDG